MENRLCSQRSVLRGFSVVWCEVIAKVANDVEQPDRASVGRIRTMLMQPTVPRPGADISVGAQVKAISQLIRVVGDIQTLGQFEQ
jgi:hypothetical protein